ncbi:hydrocephalus-inducing protein homolog [Podargus strigoides]
MAEGFQRKVEAPHTLKPVREAKQSVTLTPSAFQKEMAFTTLQRLASTWERRQPRISQLPDINESPRHKFSTADVKRSLFWSFPSEVVFQSYVPCEVYEAPLVLRNRDKVPWLVKVVMESSPYFKLISPSAVGCKVAPGMAPTFRIVFTPEENKDYFHQLTCITERETFVVPIRAKGARALLDFPEQLNFSVCPVKHSTQKTLLVRNTGNREARYSVSTRSPFSVDPSTGTLGIGDAMQVTVEFHPLQTGDHCGSLRVHYDTGEDIHTSLYGEAEDVNIWLDRSSLSVEKTYLTLSNHSSVVIHNQSDIIAHFQWKAFATEEEEDVWKLSFDKLAGSSTVECFVGPEAEAILLQDVQLPYAVPVPNTTSTAVGAPSSLSSASHEQLCVRKSQLRLLVDFPSVVAVPLSQGTPREDLMYWDCLAWGQPLAEELLLFLPELQRKEEGKMDYFLQECVVGPTLLSSTFQKQRAEVQEGSMLFPNDIFTIEPVEGDVWPRSSAEVTVTFKPREARVYQQAFYCDISGRETRLMLHVKGEGRGPRLRFNCVQLDIGEVFVGSANSYEVILFNKGAIDGVFSLVPPATALGSCFTFLPQEGIIVPGGLQVIRISFSSTILGQFREEFRFNVDGSPEPVTLTIRGCVIAPTFHFDVPSLHFGDVSFGFPHTLLCRLTNTSLVPMTFSLRIPGDGSGAPSVTSFAQMSDNAHRSWRKGAQGHVRPMEFTIIPCRGTVRALGFLDIQVTLCSNTLKIYDLALVVDMDGVGKEVLALPLTARCVVPPVRVLTPIVTFGRCLLELPSERAVTLVNSSDLPACYRVLPQDRKDAAVWYSSPVPCGVIRPRSSVEVPLTLESQVVGKQHTVAHVMVFGSEEPPLEIHLLSTGEGPVVSVHPYKLNFGQVEVLQDASRTLHLSNQTVIPASFWAEMAGKRSRWRIEPSKGVIPPDSKVSVAVIANLDGTEKFEDEVKVFIENSRSYIIPVRAVGIGTTIVTDRPLAPELSLGPHFSLCPCSYHFKITNKGRHTQWLSWTTEGFAPFHQRGRLPAISDTKGKDSSQHPKPTCPVFNLRPSRVELMPGETMEVMLEGSSSTPQVVKERLLCHALVGRKAGKVQVMQVDVTCEFVVPVLHVSPREVTFRVEKQPSDVLTLQYKPLSLKNICSLPVSVVLALEQPFFVCNADQQPFPADVQPMKLETGEELHLSIGFNPAYKEDLSSRVAQKALEIRFLEHPREEHVTVRGEVHFPKLHFPTMALDFGCILNDTEVKRSMEMTNCSQLPVRYHWAFRADSHVSRMRFSPPGPKFPTKPLSLKEEGAWLEHSASAGSRSRAGSAEEAAEALGAAGDPAQEPADADDSLEAKVFNILPEFGVVQPGKSQQVTFTFFGHTNIVARVTALCSVEGGPTYEVVLSGEASLISYLLDTTEIDCGLQLFNKVTEAKVTLQNTGKVGFTYVVPSPSTGTADSLLPGVPLALPSTGYVGPGKEQVLKVHYLPGVPGVFCRTFQIQVGHLEPEEISLKGEGSFPRICLDLPRNIKGNEKYEKALKEAKEKMGADSQRDEAAVLGEAAAEEQPTADSGAVLDTRLLMQMEQMLIEEHALEQQKALTSGPGEDTAFDQCARQRLLKAQLPEYVLDFGYVILGSIHTHIVKVTNPGQCPASFHADRRVLGNTGFSVELDSSKPLPCCETTTFRVCFDPQSASLPLGEVEVRLPVKVTGGPTFHVLLRANVVVPSLCLSRDRLEFSAVQRGQCQEETVQLHNQLQVPCKWFITRNEPVKKVDKPLPGSTRWKLLQELKAKPCVFEVLPSTGTLAPGQRCNVRVRFSPTEEKSYRSKLKISICRSSQQLQLQVSGHGLEPQLEFSPAVLELGPLLPYSHGAEGTVVVKNPCQFPIEFYSLEFDQQYLAEEEILRMLKDYDCHNTLLLPPRAPGEKLPPEVLEYYQDQKRLQDEQDKSKTGEPAGQDKAAKAQAQNPPEGGESLDRLLSALGASLLGKFSVFCLWPCRVFNGKEQIACPCAPSSSPAAGVRTVVFPFLGRAVPALSYVTLQAKMALGDLLRAKVGALSEHRQSTASSKGATGEAADSPVSRAIARHLGIDSSAEGHAARNRRGIFVIVHGAPLAGKTSAAGALSQHYGAACLSLDAVVRGALSGSASSAALRARDLCLRAAAKRSHEEPEADQNTGSSLSLQLGTKAKCGPDMSRASSRDRASLQSLSSLGQASSAAGKRRMDGPASQFWKQHPRGATGSQGSPSASLSSPLPHIPVHQQLSICGSSVGEMDFMSCVLPEEVLVAILSDRLQLRDCYQGVVFDGLETAFAPSTASALLCLLKAASNRPHIYFVDLFQDYAALKAREKAAKEQEEREREEVARRERARLWEMTEEQYDALTEEEKTQFDNSIHQVHREREKRSMEQLAQGCKEEHQRELELLKEEEELRKMSKQWKRALGKDQDNALQKKSQPGVRQDMNTSTSSHSDLTDGADSKRSVEEHPDPVAEDKEGKRKQGKVSLTDPCPAVAVPPSDPEQGETKTEALRDSENLARRFQIYEASRKDVTHILSSWDRAQGILLSPLNQEEVCHQAREKREVLSSRRGRRSREERLERERVEKEQLEKLEALMDSKLPQLEGEGAEGSGRGQAVGVPCLDIQVLSSKDVTKRILESGTLPAAEQILDVLGLGPSGPPVPPVALYSVIHCPAKRAAPAAEALEHFTFVVPGGATAGDKKKDLESAVDTPVTPTLVPSPGSSASCRWIVPACGEVELKVLFSSTVVGQFDQTLHFEVLGTKRLYQLHCRGTCLYPSISRDPRVVFPRRRKSKADDEIISKQYVMNTGVFHFGPLLCGKSRDGYKALLHPSNCEKITIRNITPLEAEVHFSFQHDVKADTFLLDPPSMRLKPKEKQELSVWAYPTSAGLVEDSLVCCIHNNPEPVVFPLCCQGVQVELGVSPKQVHFGKLLLHRMGSKTLVLQNSTPLPMAWRLSGLENLGKDFSVSENSGIVGPHTELGVHLYFKAATPCTVEKMIRLEVSDAENILGIAQVENIPVQAEAYDVALSINVPKGGDGSVDLGIVKVLGEAKQVLTLKNDGKYKVVYSFKLEAAGTTVRDLAPHFTVQPQRGVLGVSEQPVQVQLLFHPKKEMNIEHKPILRCTVIDPSIGGGGETVDTIPVRVSAKAAHSEYSINPASLLDFGAVRKGTRKTCTFTLENTGVLGFKFFINRADPDAAAWQRKSAHQVESAGSPRSDNLTKVASSDKPRKRSVQKDTDPILQAHVTPGVFTVYPGFGSVPPGGQQVITVDCYAEPLGTCKEHLSIDISDRAPSDHPHGIPYTLLAKSCLPAFVVDDIESIFEEHQICSSSDLWQILQMVQDKGVFITDENTFLFTNVLVGHQATARFKICNVGRVPCEVVLSIKPIPGKLPSCASDVFKVDPVWLCVPSRSHAFATVTFTPHSVQNYQCAFEASLDVQASHAAVPAQRLAFSVSGEGHLPRVTVLHPHLRTQRGNPLLLFRKLLLGSSAELPLVLRNSGPVPVQLVIDLLDEGGVFFLQARPTTHCICQAAGVKEDSSGEGRKPHTASLVLHHGELAEFDVLFKPTLAQRAEGKIHLSVVGSPDEETDIQLVGEGCEDDPVLDNTHGLVADSEKDTEGNLEEDVIEAARVDDIQFGDCHDRTLSQRHPQNLQRSRSKHSDKPKPSPSPGARGRRSQNRQGCDSK